MVEQGVWGEGGEDGYIRSNVCGSPYRNVGGGGQGGGGAP